MRTLRYPQGWPARNRIGERPQEKGIDVALAIDFVVMAVRRDFEVVILMSTDTDMKPALEAVAQLTATQGTRAEVASWEAQSDDTACGCQSSSATCTATGLGKDIYDQIADPVDYSA